MSSPECLLKLVFFSSDFATPPKKRRFARESMVSEDNIEGDAPEPSQSPDDQRPPVTKSSYQPVCESITDDEDDGQQVCVQRA